MNKKMKIPNSNKMVWIKRFNSDGSMKPISNWLLIEVPKSITSIVSEAVQDWDFGHYQLTTFDHEYYQWQQKSEITSAIEWVGNQRGDGWFYFEDGHAPMLNEFVLVFDGKEYSVQSFAEENLLSSKKLFQCWFPIVEPKFLKSNI